jgi:uncharacterized membrane protein
MLGVFIAACIMFGLTFAVWAILKLLEMEFVDALIIFIVSGVLLACAGITLHMISHSSKTKMNNIKMKHQQTPARDVAFRAARKV